MRIELKNGRQVDVSDAKGRVLIRARLGREVTDYENRSMADKPVVKKQVAPEVAPELDSAGEVWSADLHTATKIKNMDGTWRKKPGARAASESQE